jgi:hypothetical protein
LTDSFHWTSAPRGQRLAGQDAKIWNNPEAAAQLFASSDVVKVRDTVEHYNDKPQLIVSRILL